MLKGTGVNQPISQIPAIYTCRYDVSTSPSQISLHPFFFFFFPLSLISFHVRVLATLNPSNCNPSYHGKRYYFLRWLLRRSGFFHSFHFPFVFPFQYSNLVCTYVTSFLFKFSWMLLGFPFFQWFFSESGPFLV